MIEEQIKEMLNGIINNGEKWEGRPKYANVCDQKCSLCHISGKCLWQPYKLGDEIHADWEYRKVETWCVFKCKDNIYLRGKKEILENDRIELIFEGTKEECESYIKEHTKKSWLEEYIKLTVTKRHRKNDVVIDITEVCKKILEEVKKSNNILGSIVYKDVEDIIKDLGIEL